MEANHVKVNCEEAPADVFSLIRSPEVRDFLRKEANLDIFNKEQIILYSYISIRQKMVMLKQLADTGNEEEASLIREMHDILAQYLDQIYHPAVRTIFLLEIIFPYMEDAQIKEKSWFKDAYDTVGEVIEVLEPYSQDELGMSLDELGMSLYGYVSVVQVPQDEKLRTPFAFTLSWIGGKWQIKDIIVYGTGMESLGARGFNEDTIFRLTTTGGSYPLPFENGSRLKLQMPFMKEPFYGIISSKKSRTGKWYHHLYDENDTEGEHFISLTDGEIELTSYYSSLDWIERA